MRVGETWTRFYNEAEIRSMDEAARVAFDVVITRIKNEMITIQPVDDGKYEECLRGHGDCEEEVIQSNLVYGFTLSRQVFIGAYAKKHD